MAYRASPRPWNAEDDRRLIELVEAGKSWVLISAILKRRLPSLQDRNRYLLQRQSDKPSALFWKKQGMNRLQKFVEQGAYGEKQGRTASGQGQQLFKAST